MSSVLVALLVLSSPPEPGHVRVPVATWEAIHAELAAAARPAEPDLRVAVIDRQLRGRFDKGLLRATLRTRVVVLGDGHARVPIVDGRASVGEVRLDGRRTSLLLEDGMYTVGIEPSGAAAAGSPHEVVAEVYWGKEQDRFARKLAFRLPPDGPTALDLWLPERDVEVSVAGGAVTARPDGEGTRVTGGSGSSGVLSLSWRRKLRHDSAVAMRAEAEVLAVVALGEAVLTGVATVQLRVLEGETDRVELWVPPTLEVLAVEGDAVLQWRSEGDGQLVVLLRYLVDDEVQVRVRFQAPVEADAPVAVGFPTPREGTPFTGALGIEAAPGLEVKVAEAVGAETLTSRDIPAELADLSPTPLLYAFRFAARPTLRLTATRQAEVELTSTLVDELQASTVLLESGLEVTKLKLRVRNNTRQYLSVTLPPGALLTHSLVDGEPIRPARATVAPPDEQGDALLVPLRQSERIGGPGRVHTVRPGETLSDVANFYFSDPTAWQTILDANPALGDAGALDEGQTLKIPTRAGATVEESSFVIELAYKREGRSLGLVGAGEVTLPELDVDVVGAVWHLYLPTALEPLSFSSDLTQISALRYDPFRRARDFFERALDVRSAWASGGSYKNILSQRKVIYQEEVASAQDGDAVLAAFPLVGERYRFKRLLLGRTQPRIGFVYAARSLEHGARHLALLGALALGLYAFARPRTRREVALIAGGLVVLLVLGHFFLGLHRRIVWGLDLALLGLLGRAWLVGGGAAIARGIREPWRALELVRVRTLLVLAVTAAVLALVLAFPLLLSSMLLVVLLVLVWARSEVRHA
jgi:hypothetical protein